LSRQQWKEAAMTYVTLAIFAGMLLGLGLGTATTLALA
jgi:hypothetical protein